MLKVILSIVCLRECQELTLSTILSTLEFEREKKNTLRK